VPLTSTLGGVDIVAQAGVIIIKLVSNPATRMFIALLLV